MFIFLVLYLKSAESRGMAVKIIHLYFGIVTFYMCLVNQVTPIESAI